MKQINFNVTGSDRQRLVGIISREIGITPVYTRMPECAYKIGGIRVSKTGELIWDEQTGNDTTRALIGALAAAGFESEDQIDFTEEAAQPAGEPETEPDAGEDLNAAEIDGLTISMPMNGFSPEKLELLQKLVTSKGDLIKKSVGASSLTIRVNGDKVEFPWWGRLPSPEETQAYMALIAALCAKAKEAKRVNSSDREVRSEKFAFRVFLLSLGFIGTEHKQMRNILLKNLTGPAAFPTQEAADEFSAKQKAKRDAGKASQGTAEPAEPA
ncbi:MAG: virulence protein [Oscillospiraceae bacterium]|nr:virulence protein [Oscillospiraceae bacterium]